MKKNISIIIPCLNEQKNITRIYQEIKKKFKRKDYEIIYVDDGSKDNSQNEIITLSKKFKNVRYLFRKNDKDLSRSFFEGVKLSKSNYIILMDCDLQHDPEILNKLYDTLCVQNVSIVSGSRFMKKSINNTKKIKYIFRLMLSKILNHAINFFLNMKLTDNLTGIFISERKKILKQKKNLYLNGYKIFLDFYTTLNEPKKHIEIPIKLNERINGESKLSLKTLINIVKLILYKKFKFYR